MKARVAALLGGDIRGMDVSTFHSFCARFLRKEAAQLGYDSSFTIFDKTDSLSLVKSCIKDLSLSSGQSVPKAQLRVISNAKNRLTSPEAFAASATSYYDENTSRIYTLYQSRLRECNGMDFDDLLFNTVILLKNSDDIRDRYRLRFQYILVDEYQDTNHVQYLLLKYIVGDHHNICVVGDEDQSIYGWRGADIRNILSFEKDFPGAKIIKLEQNYRSTKIILDAASSVIKHNEARKGKTLFSQSQHGDKLKLLLVDSADEEARHVVSVIDNEQASTDLSEMVILYRTNAQSRPFEEQLRRRNLPYQIVGGISFYQRKEIKDLLAYLKLIANIKDDVSFERAIAYPKRGVGEKTVASIALLARKHSISSYEALLRHQEYQELSARWNKIQPFVELIEKYRAQRDTIPVDILTKDLVRDLKFVEILKSEDKIIGKGKAENVDALIEGMTEFAGGNGDANLITYLAEVSLYTDLDSYSQIENKISLMTLHSAKGLEYDLVVLVGLEEGLFPLQPSITEPLVLEEERRLFYVGATRAKKKLYMSSAARRHRSGEMTLQPSRFIKEIPPDLVETVDLRSALERLQGATARPPRFARHSPEATPTPKGVHYEYEGHEGLQVGRIIHHPTYGRGRIVTAEGFGESLRLQIMFTGLGLKKIMPKYVRLKILG